MENLTDILYFCKNCGFYTQIYKKMITHKGGNQCIDNIKKKLEKLSIKTTATDIEKNTLNLFIEKASSSSSLSDIEKRLTLKQCCGTEISIEDLNFIFRMQQEENYEMYFMNYSFALFSFEVLFFRYYPAPVFDYDTFKIFRINITNYGIELFRKIYYNHFHDNIYRPVEIYEDLSCQVLGFELKQILLNLKFITYDLYNNEKMKMTVKLSKGYGDKEMRQILPALFIPAPVDIDELLKYIMA
jgi:hypothetical protein